ARPAQRGAPRRPRRLPLPRGLRPALLPDAHRRDAARAQGPARLHQARMGQAPRPQRGPRLPRLRPRRRPAPAPRRLLRRRLAAPPAAGPRRRPRRPPPAPAARPGDRPLPPPRQLPEPLPMNPAAGPELLHAALLAAVLLLL